MSVPNHASDERFTERMSLALAFAGLWGVTVAVSLALVWLLIRIDVERNLGELRQSEQSRVELAAHRLHDDVRHLLEDLRLIARLPALSDLLIHDDDMARQRLGMEYLEFARAKGRYDRVRVLDEQGMELVRVNGNGGDPLVAPPSEPQSGGDRDYFQAAWRLAAGQVFLSPLELEVENGGVERPLKPMIRLATPVADFSGRKRGVVLLDYLAEGLLSDFQNHLRGPHRVGMLLNREGYWLSHPDAEQSWGFMFPEEPARLGQRFDLSYPEVWRRMVEQGHGAMRNEEGLFLFGAVSPLDPAPASVGAGADASGYLLSEYGWWVVQFIPAVGLPGTDSSHYVRYWGFTWFALAAVALLEWILLLNHFGRRRSLRALAESERHLREVTETLAEGIYVLDIEGRIAFVNQECCRLLGWSAKDLLGRSSHDLFHRCQRNGAPLSAAECPIFNAISRQEVYRGDDDAFRRKDGSQFLVAVSSSPIVRDGRVVGSVVAFHDATARKQAEEELERHRGRLEELVAERTRDLEVEIARRAALEEVLRQAKETAEFANRAKSAFVTQISHELRTPLNAVLGYAQVLEGSAGLLPEERRMVQTIRFSGDHLLTLINDLLDLAKIEANRMEIVPGSCVLALFLRGLHQICAIRAQEKGVGFLTEEATPLPERIFIDERRLLQICLNLLGNAIKFTEQGAVRLRVGYEGARLWIEVIDSGAGIAPDELTSIFEPFQQAGSARSRALGVGLGLSIARKLAELMGGRLEAASELGRGSRFRLELPAQVLEGALPAMPSVAPAEESLPLFPAPGESSATPPGSPLSAVHHAELMRLLRRGAVEELRVLLAQMAEEPEPPGLLPRLAELAAGFRLREMRLLLERQGEPAAGYPQDMHNLPIPSSEAITQGSATCQIPE